MKGARGLKLNRRGRTLKDRLIVALQRLQDPTRTEDRRGVRPAAARELRRILSEVEQGADTAPKLQQVVADLESTLLRLEDRARALSAMQASTPRILAYDHREPLQTYVQAAATPWDSLAPRPLHVPGMISDEERRYYEYIGRFYRGHGAAIELGPWLGASTHHIVAGLRTNPRFTNRPLIVVDDFVWRTSWMNKHVSPKEQLPNHTNFRHLFQKYTEAIQPYLDVRRLRIADYDGNEGIPSLSWDEGPIEMLFVDCGRTVAANEGWYKVLAPHLTENALIVMQDWRLHRERPRKWFNQTDLFTESKGDALQLIHELRDGGVATFLFRKK